MGFSRFQGYFFSKPEMVSSRDIRPNKAILLGIVGEIFGNECHIENMERLFKNDVSLSIKLLQMVNSAFYQRVNNITSIRHALSYLGCRDIKRLVTMIVIADLASEKPAERQVAEAYLGAIQWVDAALRYCKNRPPILCPPLKGRSCQTGVSFMRWYAGDRRCRL